MSEIKIRSNALHVVKKIKGSLIFRTTLFFLIAAIIPYLIVISVILARSEDILHKKIVSSLNDEAGYIRDSLDDTLYHMRNNATAWAGLEVMKDIIIYDVDKRINTTLAGLKGEYGINGEIYIFNRDRVIISSTNDSFITKKVSPAWLDKIFAGEMIELGARTSELDKISVFTFGAPVRSELTASRIIGGIIIEYQVKALEMGMASAYALVDKNGALLVESEGWPGGPDFTQNATYIPGYITASAQTKGYREFKGFGWSVALAVEERKALAPVLKLKQLVFWAGVCGIILILLFVYYLAGRTVAPLKKLARTALDIAETKNFSMRVGAAGSGDEIDQVAAGLDHLLDEVNKHIEQIGVMEDRLRMSDRLSSLGEFSAGMAHEIKNPLGVIKSSSDLLKERLSSQTTNYALAAAISEETERLSKLLETFLAFARPQRPSRAMCRVNDVVERSLNLLTPDLIKSDIILSVVMEPDLPEIDSDQDQLHQVFLNIIINAIQATPRGGRLTVETGKIPADTARGIRDSIRISVTDTGEGIKPDLKDKIFNPFFTTKEKGTGLGLAIVHRIIEGLGGWIEVSDAPVTGTIFAIYLPVGKETLK